MIRTVFVDLMPFLFFFAILTLLFSLMIGILGIGNFDVPGQFAKENSPDDDGYFGEEYSRIGLFIGNWMQTLRISMGDFDFDGANDLDDDLNRVYWFIWLVMVVVTCIIFLNFVIAEACASYEKVMGNL